MEKKLVKTLGKQGGTVVASCALRCLLSALSLVAALLPLHADYQFRHFDVSQGLSQYSVLAVAQDDMGFMWFGTKDGLNRFDGSSFKVYRTGTDSHGLDCDFVNCLYKDALNRLWVGTSDGVYVYTPYTDSFERFSLSVDGLSPTGNVNMIVGYGDEIYINSQREGLFRFNLKAQTLENFPLSGFSNVTSLAVAPDGRVWMGMFGGGLFYADHSFSRVITYADAAGRDPFDGCTVFGIVPTEQDRLFVCTSLSGLQEVDLKLNTVVGVTDSRQPVYGHAILRSGNEIWMASEDGLYVFELITRQLQHYGYEPSNPYSLSDNSLQCLFLDQDGGVWAGSYFGGVNYSPRQTYALEKFFPRVDRQNSLSGRRVREFVEDADGHIWIGTEDHGLNCYDPLTGHFRYVEESAAFPNIHGLCLVGDELWVGTFSSGLKILDRKTGHVVRSYLSSLQPGALPDNNVFSICQADGRVYLGQLSGLSVYDPHTDTFTADPVVNGKIVYDILSDSRGALWVALYGGGLYRRTAESADWHHYAATDSLHGLPSDNVLSIFEDSHRQIWITTEGGGVARYDTTADSFEPVAVPDHQPRRTVYQIAEDRSGQL